MSSQASGREIYSLGINGTGNREVVIVEDGKEHDLPAAAEVTYASARAQFPYTIPA